MTDQTCAIDVPAYALRVVDVLEDAGYEAWVVGGFVRDALLGGSGHDVDVTTSAPWQETARALRAAGVEVHETGAQHGTVTAVVDGLPVETTTYRVEGVVPSSCALRGRPRGPRPARLHRERDGLPSRARAFGHLWRPRTPRPRRHPRGGGAPPTLRGGRAARVACGALAVASALPSIRYAVEALVACAPELAGIAHERIGQEMDGIFASGRVAWALRHEFEVLAAAIPELAPMRGFDQKSPYHAYDVLEHTARVCAGAEEFTGGFAPRTLRWAALLHDVAKPACWSVDEGGRGHFFGHPEEGARMAGEVMGRLAIERSTVREAQAIIRLHDLPIHPTVRSIRRMLAKLEGACPGRGEALAHALIDLKRSDAVGKAPKCMGYAAELDAMERVLRAEIARGAVCAIGDLKVNGADVMRERGIEPGPGVGMVLRSLLDAVLADELPNDREALLAELRYR